MRSDIKHELILPSSLIHGSFKTSYSPSKPRRGGSASGPSSLVLSAYGGVRTSGSSDHGKYDPTNIPTIMIYTSLVKPPDLVDVSNADHPDIFEFVRGELRYNIRTRYNRSSTSAQAQGYLWNIAYSFIDRLRGDTNKPPPTVRRIPAEEGDCLVELLKEYTRLDRECYNQEHLAWVQNKRSELNLTDDHFTIEVVDDQEEYESAEPQTSLPDGYKSMSKDEVHASFERFRGYRLGDFTVRPTSSVKSNVPLSQRIFWRVKRPCVAHSQEHIST